MSFSKLHSRALSQLAPFNTPGNRESPSFLDGARLTRSCTYNVSTHRLLPLTKVKSTTALKPSALAVVPLPSPSAPSPEFPPIASRLPAAAFQLSPSSSHIINDIAPDDDRDLSYNPPLNTPISPSNSTYPLAAQRDVARIQSSINKASLNRLSDEDLTLEPSQSLHQIAHHKRLSLRVPLACRPIFIETARTILQCFNDALKANIDQRSIFFHFVNLLLLPSLCFSSSRGGGKRKNRNIAACTRRLEHIRKALNADDQLAAASETASPNPTTCIIDPTSSLVKFAS